MEGSTNGMERWVAGSTANSSAERPAARPARPCKAPRDPCLAPVRPRSGLPRPKQPAPLAHLEHALHLCPTMISMTKLFIFT